MPSFSANIVLLGGFDALSKIINCLILVIFFSALAVKQELADDLLQALILSSQFSHLDDTGLNSTLGAYPVVNGFSADTEFSKGLFNRKTIIFNLIYYPILDFRIYFSIHIFAMFLLVNYILTHCRRLRNSCPNFRVPANAMGAMV